MKPFYKPEKNNVGKTSDDMVEVVDTKTIAIACVTFTTELL